MNLDVLDDSSISKPPYTGPNMEPLPDQPIVAKDMLALLNQEYPDESVAAGGSDVALTHEGAVKAWDTRGRGGTGKSTRDLAMGLYEAAKNIEPQITSVVKGTVEGMGGEVSGLKNCLKRPESIESKISRDMVEMDIDQEQAAAGMTDTVRYTAVFPPEKLVDGALGMHQALETQGYTQYDTKWRNYWTPGNDYQGYNCVYTNKNTGMRFELQFHTQQSLAIKKTNHKLYEKAREMPEGPERHKLIVQMKKNWETLARPVGWENLPGIIIVPK